MGSQEKVPPPPPHLPLQEPLRQVSPPWSRLERYSWIDKTTKVSESPWCCNLCVHYFYFKNKSHWFVCLQPLKWFVPICFALHTVLSLLFSLFFCCFFFLSDANLGLWIGCAEEKFIYFGLFKCCLNSVQELFALQLVLLFWVTNVVFFEYFSDVRIFFFLSFKPPSFPSPPWPVYVSCSNSAFASKHHFIMIMNLNDWPPVTLIPLRAPV